MWITGFDVPSCSTIYLDKPMRNHTLMQTIARANRVWKTKQNGLIVDYVGIFRNLQKALAIYGATEGRTGPQDQPIKEKAALVAELREAIAKAAAFCRSQGAEVDAIAKTTDVAHRIRMMDDAVDALVKRDETRRQYLLLAGGVGKLHKSLLPDAAAAEFGAACKVFKVLAEKVRLTLPPADISGVMADVESLLDESIEADGYVIRGTGGRIDLSEIDFEALRQQFEGGRRATAAQRLRSQVARILTEMIRANRTRMNYQEEFQQMIDEYNAGAANVEDFFAKLMAFTRKLSDEQKRGIAENLSEEELVIFDLLTKPDVRLTKAEEIEVKKVAKDLLEKLKAEKLVLDWKQKQTTRASVRYTIETVLDGLPRAYTTEMFETKCDAVYQHVFESYGGRSV
jgi:type I restriction enzyme R subunit